MIEIKQTEIHTTKMIQHEYLIDGTTQTKRGLISSAQYYNLYTNFTLNLLPTCTLPLIRVIPTGYFKFYLQCIETVYSYYLRTLFINQI